MSRTTRMTGTGSKVLDHCVESLDRAQVLVRSINRVLAIECRFIGADVSTAHPNHPAIAAFHE